MECVICLEEITTVPKYPGCNVCKVPMHLECYKLLSQIHISCPICKHWVVEDVVIKKDYLPKFMYGILIFIIINYDLILMLSTSLLLFMFPEFSAMLICGFMFLSGQFLPT